MKRLIDIISDVTEGLENRKQEKEVERDLQARRGKLQMKLHIKKQTEMAQKLWGLGKRALQLGDTKQFEQIGKQYLWTLEDVKRWERFLLTFEAIEARKDQAKSIGEFMASVQAMSKSMIANVNPAEFAKTQRDLELALARAQNLEQTMDILMETTDESVFAASEVSDRDLTASLNEIERTMKQEAETGKTDADADARIAEGLKKIEEEMKRK